MKSLKRILSLWVLLIVASWATMQGAQPKYIFYFMVNLFIIVNQKL